MFVVVDVNYVAILVAGIISMVLGFLWYGPLFGKQWIGLMGITQQQIDEYKKSGQSAMAKQYIITFIGALVMAYVLAHAVTFVGSFFGVNGVSLGLMVGFFTWIGFIAPVLLGSVLWEGKSWNLYVLNAAYWLVLLLVNGVILSVWV